MRLEAGRGLANVDNVEQQTILNVLKLKKRRRKNKKYRLFFLPKYILHLILMSSMSIVSCGDPEVKDHLPFYQHLMYHCLV